MAPRKPRPEPLDRATVETMIAEAVAAERTRSDQALAGVMLALGGAGAALDGMAEVLIGTGERLDLHEGLLRPMADAFAAGLDIADPVDTPIPN